MATNIDYEQIKVSLNQYGNEIMSMIKQQYGYSISNLENIPDKDFIVVEQPNNADIEFFSRQNGFENPGKFNISNVPSAHGGRTKGDGKIHIYPYSAKAFGKCTSTEEIIGKCKQDIIIHEIFHYFIKPKIDYPKDSVEAEFGHYITEGIVQGYAESFAINNNLPIPKSNYNKNVIMAAELLNNMPEGTDINFMVFNESFTDLIKKSTKGKVLISRYIEDKNFYNKINNIIDRGASLAGFSKEQIASMQRYYSNIDDKEHILKDISDKIQTIFIDNENLAQEFITDLNSMNPNMEVSEEKSYDQTLEQEGPKLVRKLPQQNNTDSSTTNNMGKINLTLIIIISFILLFVAIMGTYIFYRLG